MSTLLAIRGPLTGARLRLEEPRTIIGRSSSCTITLADNTVSRQHASITRHRMGWLLEDAGSASGTLLNGRPVQGSAALTPNDEIRIGHSIFLYDSEFDLQNADYTDNSVYFSSPNDETMEVSPVAVLDPPVLEGRDRPSPAVQRDFLSGLGELFDSSKVPFGDALRRTTERLAHLLHADKCVLLLYDSANRRPRVAAAVAPGDLLIDQSILVKVFAEKRALLLSDKPDISRHPAPGAPAAPGTRSVIAAPLLVEDACLGLLYFERQELDAYSLKDLRLGQALGCLLGVFVEARQKAEATALRARFQSTGSGVVGGSVRFRKTLDLIRKAAASSVPILLLGETGSGKEVLAREVHRLSPQGAADGPFLAINCAAIPENLFESELFGYEKGAFTGASRTRPGLIEQANGGTLFLDEIGEMALALQPKLLRFLQEATFTRVGGHRLHQANVRIIAATNRSLLEDVRSERFRADLFHRLSVLPIEVPPLRERPEDIRLLAEHFCQRFAEQMHKEVVGISDDALIALEKYPWPGNVRELANCLERAVLLCDGKILLPRHFVLRPLERPDVPVAAPLPASPDEPTRMLGEGMAGAGVKAPPAGELRSLADVEKEHIARVMEALDHNQVRAAEVLGIHRNTLRKKLVEYGLER